MDGSAARHVHTCLGISCMDGHTAAAADDERSAFFIEGIEIRTIPGRGRGLVATRAFRRHETLFATAAFGFADTGGLAHGCATCLCFSDSPLTYPCEGGCSTAYCSAECRLTDLSWGHKLCCAALCRVAAVGERRRARRALERRRHQRALLNLPVLLVDDSGQAEVADAHLAGAGEEHVGRLEITV